MDKNKLFLVFVNEIGKDWKGEFLYEFLFSNNIEGVDGEAWDEYPASGKPEPPDKEFIKSVGKLSSGLKFDVVQNSDTFSVWDAVDGVIALAWENTDGYDEYPEKRMFFKFGETLQSVEDKLYEQDIILELIKIGNHEKAEK